MSFIADAVARAQAALEKARQDPGNAMNATSSGQQAAAQWKQYEATIEDALEHAGISGIDVQIDERGHATLVGGVSSDEQRATAVAMVEQFQVTGLDVQLEVMAPMGPATNNPLDGAHGPVQYTVKAGESWWGIANRIYGDGKLWKQLKAKNNNPKMLHPGAVITLPRKEELV